MDSFFHRELGAAKDSISAIRPVEGDHGSGDQRDSVADGRAPPDAETDGDPLADADAAPDRVSRSDRKAGAAGHRPARVRVCGHTRAGDRGNRRCGGEEQKTEKARTKEEIGITMGIVRHKENAMPRKVKLFAAGLLLAVIGIACVAMAGKSAHAEWDRTYMAYDGNSWSMSEEGVLKIESDEGWLDYLKYSITDYSISFVPEEINELVIGKDVTNLRMYNLPYELPMDWLH